MWRCIHGNGKVCQAGQGSTGMFINPNSQDLTVAVTMMSHIPSLECADVEGQDGEDNSESDRGHKTTNVLVVPN